MKTEDVEKLVMEGKMKEALKIAGKFKRTFTGLSKDDLYVIQTGYGCLTNPDFYLSLNKDIDEEINKAYEVLERVYIKSGLNKKQKKIRNQINTLLQITNSHVIKSNDIINIIGVESVEDKNIALNYLREIDYEIN